jgi:hypothetical protein
MLQIGKFEAPRGMVDACEKEQAELAKPGEENSLGFSHFMAPPRNTNDDDLLRGIGPASPEGYRDIKHKGGPRLWVRMARYKHPGPGHLTPPPEAESFSIIAVLNDLRCRKHEPDVDRLQCSKKVEDEQRPHDEEVAMKWDCKVETLRASPLYQLQLEASKVFKEINSALWPIIYEDTWILLKAALALISFHITAKLNKNISDGTSGGSNWQLIQQLNDFVETMDQKFIQTNGREESRREATRGFNGNVRAVTSPDRPPEDSEPYMELIERPRKRLRRKQTSGSDDLSVKSSGL